MNWICTVCAGFSTEMVDKLGRMIMLTNMGNFLFNHGFSAALAAL